MDRKVAIRGVTRAALATFVVAVVLIFAAVWAITVSSQIKEVVSYILSLEFWTESNRIRIVVVLLFGSIWLFDKLYVRSRHRKNATLRDISEERRERRGGATWGALRDDAFERKLDWLRERKYVVSVAETFAIIAFVLFVILMGGF